MLPTESPSFINQLPKINRRVEIQFTGQIGENFPTPNSDRTKCLPASRPNAYRIWVGDSKQGWAEACWNLFNLTTKEGDEAIHLNIYLGLICLTEKSEKLPAMFLNTASILNNAVGRRLSTEEFCLVIKEVVTTIISDSNKECER